ncbi:hypothetical protein Taro_016434 [Colocasia esculenta]|uniref:Uncharacterized protein n=1 Tax=Colocasia esculenta TaxID=4460 RepID=A0A843UKP9_COLES|nr:hypothetical protein [Colocasia esculenta]
MRVATGSTEIAMGSCTGRNGLVGSGRQVATGSYEEGDRSVRPEGQVATGVLLRSDRDGDACRDLPENAAYRAVAFSGYNRLVDHVGIHDQRRLTEALCKGSLVRRKEYPTESSPQAK